MYIVFEEYPYNPEDVKDVLRGIIELQTVGKTITANCVGYYYDPRLEDCVFVLPKVLLNKDNKLVVYPPIEGQESLVEPEKIITREGQEKYLSPEYRKFLYNFAVWIYRSLKVYQDTNRTSTIIYYQHLPIVGSGARHRAHTYLDVLLELIRFSNENQDFFMYTVKNIHSGYNKINWTRTISHSQAYFQDGTPIYTNPVNKKRQINFDEELFVIYFSILNHINEEYGFRAPICLNYELLNKQQINRYCKGYGKSRLRQIKYKYFSDKALLLWDLCYAFFDSNYQLSINSTNKEYLLAKNYNIVFETMIDTLIGTPHENIPHGLADQPDGKQVDHLYTDLALTSAGDEKRSVYYIGDSKYYKMSTPLGEGSVAKQYTYARNVIQWNINLWKQDEKGEKLRAETAEEYKRIQLRLDPNTEGYDIIPNFFLSADVDEHHNYDRGRDGKTDLNIVPKLDTNEKDLVYFSTHFDNRLFDRDSLLLLYYNVNFLFIVRMYARNNSSEQESWKKQVRETFRTQIQEYLKKRFDFYALAPRETTYAAGYIKEHFKDLIGKLYTPFTNPEMFVLALDNTNSHLEENRKLVNELGQYFYLIGKDDEYEIGKDPTKLLTNKGYTHGESSQSIQAEWVLANEAKKEKRERMVEKKICYAPAAFEKGSLRLIPGYEKTKYVLLHDGGKGDLFELAGKGAKFAPKEALAAELGVELKDLSHDYYLIFELKSKTPFAQNIVVPSEGALTSTPHFIKYTTLSLLGD